MYMCRPQIYNLTAYKSGMPGCGHIILEFFFQFTCKMEGRFKSEQKNVPKTCMARCMIHKVSEKL